MHEAPILQVMNATTFISLSTKTLTRDQEAVLELGLKFIPSQKQDVAHLKMEAMELFRKIRLHTFFKNKELTPSGEVSGLRNKSTFCPPPNTVPKNVVTFEQTVL